MHRERRGQSVGHQDDQDEAEREHPGLFWNLHLGPSLAGSGQVDDDRDLSAPMNKIEGVGDGGYSLPLPALNQWSKQVLQDIKACRGKSCGGDGSCWGEWRRDGDRPFVVPTGCQCDPGYSNRHCGTGLSSSTTPVPTMPPTMTPTSQCAAADQDADQATHAKADIGKL